MSVDYLDTVLHFKEIHLNIQDLLKLIGVVIVVVGLALRLRTTLVVVVAALATGLVAGLPLFSHEGFFQHLPYLTRPGQTGIINTLGGPSPTTGW